MRSLPSVQEPREQERDAEVPRERPSILMGGAHLAGLWAISMVQPLFSLLGSNPDFFVARDNTRGQIILFTLLVTILPPLVATLVEAAVNLVSRPARWALHLFLVAILFAALVMQFMKQLADGPAIPMIVLALLAGAFLAWAYGYRKFVRSLADILIVAPVIIVVAFLLFSGVSKLITTSGEVDAIDVEVGNPAPVVMVLFDEFPVGSLMTPAGDINARRFPHFAELANRANWYRNTVIGGSYTALAVPSILTGKTVDPDLLPTAAEHPESIFTLLGGSYRVRAVEPITQLCPPGICGQPEDQQTGTTDAVKGLFTDLRYVSEHLTLPESMSKDQADISQGFEGFGGQDESTGDTVERGRARQFVRNQLDQGGEGSLDAEGDVNDFFASIDPSVSRSFDFVHAEEPHYPWTHYPNGMRYTDGSEDFRQFFNDTEWLDDGYVTDRAHQSHLLETGYADFLLGRIIDRLKEDGRWDDSLFIVTADHGGAMTKGSPRREASPPTLGQIAMVPLFIKAPGQKAGRVVDRPTCSTEILPMMAAYLEIKVPWEAGQCDRNEVSLDNGTGSGDLVTSPMATVIGQRQEYIDRLASLFGGDTGWSSVLKLGPDKALIGTPAAAIISSESVPDVSISPEGSATERNSFNRAARFNPVLRQRGSLGGIDAETPLAVTVNGVVMAVGQSYQEGDRVLYSILLPTGYLRQGPNDIRLNLIERDSDGVRLKPLG